jgi:DNA-directed RNA polymerase subunit RPC12/RpoP
MSDVARSSSKRAEIVEGYSNSRRHRSGNMHYDCAKCGPGTVKNVENGSITGLTCEGCGHTGHVARSFNGTVEFVSVGFVRA